MKIMQTVKHKQDKLSIDMYKDLSFDFIVIF